MMSMMDGQMLVPVVRGGMVVMTVSKYLKSPTRICITAHRNGTQLPQFPGHQHAHKTMKTDESTHVDILYLAALNSPAKTNPNTTEPITAPATLSARNVSKTRSANVSRERRWGFERGRRSGSLAGKVCSVSDRGKGDSGYDGDHALLESEREFWDGGKVRFRKAKIPQTRKTGV